MGISLGQAARQLKISKGTLSKAISSGKLSATRNTDSSWSIDAAELQRYWNEHGHRFNRSSTVENDQPEPSAATDALVASLHDTIALLKQANTSLEAKYATLEQDRDDWREQFKQLRLPAPKPQETAQATQAGQGAPPPDPVTKPVGARLRGFLFASDPIWNWWRRSA